MNKKVIIVISAIVILALVTIYLTVFYNNNKNDIKEEEEIVIPIEKFGIIVDDWNILSDTVRQGEILGIIMNKYGISPVQIDKISKLSSDTANYTMLKIGRPYHIFYDTIIDEKPIAKIFVYENSKTMYTKYDFRNNDSILIERFYKKVDTICGTASGTITSSLWKTISDNGYDWNLAIAMSQTFAWTVDFYAIQKGDWFKVVYDDLYVDNEKIGFGEVKAGVFYNGGKELWAIPFEQDSVVCFYDTLGNSMRKTFLKAPLQYTRVSSRYSNARMHPIHHQPIAHLAVDFAAPYGTPIYAASDGVITRKGWDNGGGNFIAIRHNSVYTTVYMHLSSFGKFNSGQRVAQGDIIGYVGSTGWSTGPHLHYEIHENGKKIDPLNFNPPAAEPVDSANIERFNVEKRKWIDLINEIKFND